MAAAASSVQEGGDELVELGAGGWSIICSSSSSARACGGLDIGIKHGSKRVKDGCLRRTLRPLRVSLSVACRSRRAFLSSASFCFLASISASTNWLSGQAGSALIGCKLTPPRVHAESRLP